MLAFAMLVFVPGAVGRANANDIDVPPCPFDASEGDIVIDGGFLLGAAPKEPNAIVVSTPIPEGVYRVFWASYDNHSDHPNQPGQTEEVWYLDAGGDTSDSTVDIPDASNFVQGELASYFAVGSAQPSVTVRHGGPSGKTNSVYPVCAVLVPVPAPPTLTIVKNSINGDDDFRFLSKQLDDPLITTISGTGSDTFAPLKPGTYTIAEDLEALGDGWSFTSLTCTGATKSSTVGAAASVTLSAGDTAECIFTNTYEPPQDPPTLTLVKVVDNTGGGTARASEWTLSAVGDDGFSGTGTPTDETDSAAVLGPNPVTAGVTYTLSETGPAGYEPSNWVCRIGGDQDQRLSQIAIGEPNTIQLQNGQNAVCSIINTFQPAPGIHIEKATNGQDADTPTGPQVLVGSTVTWTYVVTNTGNVPLTNIVVTDDELGPISGPISGDDGDDEILGLTETWTYKAIGTASAGQYANLGTVTGDYTYDECFLENAAGTTDEATVEVIVDPCKKTVGDEDLSHYIGVTKPPVDEPGIDIEKATNGQDADTPTGPQISVGSTVTWTYVVTNTGNVPLTNVKVTDDQGVTPVYENGDNGNNVLDVGETWVYEASGTAALGQYKNTGTATGVSGASLVTDSDLSHYIGVSPPPDAGLSIDKLVNNLDGTWVDVATYPNDQATVTWQITLANPTASAVFKVTLSDAVAPSCETALNDALTGKGWTNADGGFLPAGESITIECTEDLLAGVPVINVAIANGVDKNDRAVPSVEDDATVQRVLANASIGDTVWSDENANGVQDNGEKGIAGATVRLTLPDGSVVETTTNSNGLYLFSALDAGTYTAEIVLSSIPKPSEGDLALTTAGSFTIQLADEQSYLDADFGVVATLPKTGLDIGAILGIALALLLAGAASVLVTRRKRQDGGITA